MGAESTSQKRARLIAESEAKGAAFWAKWTRAYTIARVNALREHNRHAGAYRHPGHPELDSRSASPELSRAAAKYRLPLY